jgi:hypothetical protein
VIVPLNFFFGCKFELGRPNHVLNSNSAHAVCKFV